MSYGRSPQYISRGLVRANPTSREASLESNADTQAVLKIVGGAQPLSKQSLTYNIIAERDDYVARIEAQDYVAGRIKFGNAAYI
jgi:hypothetical protein